MASPEVQLDYAHVLLAAGQGNQRTHMGQDLAGRSKAADQVWKMADKVLLPQLGRNLTSIVWNPEEKNLKDAEAELQLTENAQLAVIIDGLARTAALEEAGLLKAPGWHAGNSVGMITALVNVGALSIDAAVHLGKGRGEAFRQAIDNGPKTTMVALDLGMVDRSVLKQLRDSKGEYKLETCLINSDRQYVLGGPVEVIQAAIEDLKGQGIEDGVYPLMVDAAFHSKYMSKGVETWRQVVADTPIETPKNGRIVGGSTVSELLTPDDIRRELVLQLTQTERGRDMMWYLRSQGAVIMTELNSSTRLTKINMDNFRIGRDGNPFIALSLPKSEGEKSVVIGYRLTNHHKEVSPREPMKEWYMEWVADRMGRNVEEFQESDDFMKDAGLESEDLKALRADVRKKFRKLVPDDQAEENYTIGFAINATYRMVNTPAVSEAV